MWPFKVNKVYLENVTGISRLSGTDTQGNSWVQFEVDYFADQSDGTCVICNKEISSGWLCLDGGEEVCEEHVVIKNRI